MKNRFHLLVTVVVILHEGIKASCKEEGTKEHQSLTIFQDVELKVDVLINVISIDFEIEAEDLDVG